MAKEGSEALRWKLKFTGFKIERHMSKEGSSRQWDEK